MNKPTSYKSKQFLFPLIKLSIVFSICYFIYYKLAHNEHLDLETLWLILHQKIFINPNNYIVLILMSLINWYFEILKWKITVSPVKKISFFEASKQSLGALTVALITPNKVGEYGAKMLFFDKFLRKKVIFLNLVHNFSQLSATLIFGGIGSYFFFVIYKPSLSFSMPYFWGFVFLIIIFLSAFYFRKKRVDINRLKTFTRKIPSKTRFKVLGLSFLRYLIFSHQFYFLLILFNVDINYRLIMIGITTFYFINTALPMLFLFDVVIKGGVALWVFSFMEINELTVITTVFLMWLLNFVFPSLIGSYFVFNFKASNYLKIAEDT